MNNLNPLPSFKNRQEILDYLNNFSPTKYEATRNYLSGQVSHLSPYITAGVISLNQIRYQLLSKNSLKDCHKIIQELAWRDFFASVKLAKGEAIFTDLRQPQANQVSDEMPKSILEGKTGIVSLDSAINKLYKVGYLHNHERMWLASLVCNIAGTSWLTGAKWMYYHLVDGDAASNMLSWQWVAGTFSPKKYFANQENINKYTIGYQNLANVSSLQNQFKTFLDFSYEQLEQNAQDAVIPEILKDRSELIFPDSSGKAKPNWSDLNIPEKRIFKVVDDNNSGQIIRVCTDSTITFPDNSSEEENNQALDIIFIDSQSWEKLPFGQNRLNLILSLGQHQIFYGTKIELEKLINHQFDILVQERMFPQLTDYYPSFFKFWSKAEKLI